MARGLALVGVLTAAAGAHAEVCDSVALAQWTHRVNPTVLEAGPTDFATIQAPTGLVPPSPLDILRDLPSMINQSMSEGSNITAKGSKNAGPVNTGGGMSDMMQTMNVLFDAVKSETFMGNATWLIKELNTLVKASVKKGEAALEKYSFNSRTAKDKEMPGLTVWLFNNFTNTTLEMFKSMERAVIATNKSMPKKISEMLDTTGSANPEHKEELASGTSFRLMPENSTREQVCHMAEIRLLDLEFLAEQDRKAVKFINGTQKMLPMMKDYMSKTRPEVAPRVEYLLAMYMDSNYDMMVEQAEFLELLTEQTKPVLKARLGCKTSSGAPRAASLGFLSLALLLATWLSER